MHNSDAVKQVYLGAVLAGVPAAAARSAAASSEAVGADGRFVARHRSSMNAVHRILGIA
jgi:hypothetical protein